jgi:ABC-type nitrate/sulfonate/bicarbonate transport system substrate-binding protein
LGYAFGLDFMIATAPRRWLLPLAGCLGLLAACSGSAPAGPPAAASPSSQPSAARPSAAAASFRVAASQNVTGNAPVWLTQRANLFAQAGLTANLQSINASNGIKELVAGHIDGYVGGSPEAISARAAGSPVSIVAVFQNKYDMVMTVPKDVTSMDQLKGKIIGVITKASVNGVGTVAAFKKYGLQADKDYQLVETGSGGAYQSLVAALLSHQVAAAALQPDLARKASADGQFHVLFDLAQQPDLITAGSSLTVQTSYMQQHPAEVQKAVDALLQGQHYFRDHKQDAEAVLRDTFKLSDQSDLDTAYNRLVQLMASDPTPRPELYPDLVAALSQLNPDVKSLDLSTLLEPRFAQDALKRGLTG